MERFVVAVDLGGTKIAAARVGAGGGLTQLLEVPTPPAGGKAVVASIAALIRQIGCEGACAVGVDVPGLAYADGSVWAPNLAGWKRMPLGRMLAAEFKLPVLVESDRNACVVGEAWQGAARGCLDVVFLAIGTGIGAGIISGGHLIRGHGELAGALGWMAVETRYRAAYGAVGCLESHLAGPALAHAASRARRRPTSMPELVARARRGDAAALRVIANAGHYLGLVLANLVSTLNPEQIVLGGGVAAAGPMLIAPARKTMREWAQPLAVKQVRIVRSRLGTRAGLLGAAKMAFERAAVPAGAIAGTR